MRARTTDLPAGSGRLQQRLWLRLHPTLAMQTDLPVVARDPEERVPTTVGTTTVSELRARCSVLEPGIVLMRETPNGTADTYEVLIARCNELGARFERFAVVVDLTDLNVRPRGRYLERIRESLRGPAVHFAVTQPGSPFLRTVLGFVLGRVSPLTSVHPNLEAALAAARTLMR